MINATRISIQIALRAATVTALAPPPPSGIARYPFCRFHRTGDTPRLRAGGGRVRPYTGYRAACFRLINDLWKRFSPAVYFYFFFVGPTEWGDGRTGARRRPHDTCPRVRGCVCVRVCVYVRAKVYGYTSIKYIYVYVLYIYMRVRVRKCLSVCVTRTVRVTCLRVCLCLYLCVCVCVRPCECVWLSVRVCICVVCACDKSKASGGHPQWARVSTHAHYVETWENTISHPRARIAHPKNHPAHVITLR